MHIKCILGPVVQKCNIIIFANKSMKAAGGSKGCKWTKEMTTGDNIIASYI